jgi:hypothetical protein
MKIVHQEVTAKAISSATTNEEMENINSTPECNNQYE